MFASTALLCFLGLAGGMIVYWLGGVPAVVMLVLVVAIGLTGVRIYQRVTAPGDRRDRGGPHHE